MRVNAEPHEQKTRPKDLFQREKCQGTTLVVPTCVPSSSIPSKHQPARPRFQWASPKLLQAPAFENQHRSFDFVGRCKRPTPVSG
jgi:hypothetical protein